jgi:hypothetical protein
MEIARQAIPALSLKNDQLSANTTRASQRAKRRGELLVDKFIMINRANLRANNSPG